MRASIGLPAVGLDARPTLRPDAAASAPVADAARALAGGLDAYRP